MGARVGNMVFSSGIAGKDPATDKVPPEPERQAYFAFHNMKTLLTAAGASTGDVGHITVYVADNTMRDHVNKEWLALFPDQHDRPARHTIVQPEIIAVIADGG
jgi:2-iminobutanoate/2-iminopropanoate deaminase